MNEDKATRYHRRRRRTELASLAAAGGVLVGVLATGATTRLRDLASALGGSLPLFHGDAATVVVLSALLLGALQAVEFPFAHSAHALERRYGLSTQAWSHWLADSAKAAALALGFGVAASSAVYAALRWSPEWWWALGAAASVATLVSVTALAPVLLVPLFHRCVPLDRPDLVARLRALGDRAGTGVARVFEWQIGGHTRKANALLAGLGRTRRILLSDTLLRDYPDDEIEIVAAHELSHHVHHDLWRSLALQAAVVTGGFWVAHQVLARLAGPLGLAGRADPAGLPLLLLTAGFWSLLWGPAANALSRAHERRADRFALEITGNPAAFVSAMRRLGQQNLAEESPSALAVWLFHSHPPIRERIDRARAWSAPDGAGVA